MEHLEPRKLGIALAKRVKKLQSIFARFTALNPCKDPARQAERLITNMKRDALDSMCFLTSHMDLLAPLWVL